MKTIPSICHESVQMIRSCSHRCDVLEAKMTTSENDLLGLKTAIIPIERRLGELLSKADSSASDSSHLRSLVAECMIKSESVDSRLREIENQIARVSDENDSRFAHLERDIYHRLGTVETEQRVSLENIRESLKSFDTTSKQTPVLNSLIRTVQKMVAETRMDVFVKSLRFDVMKAWNHQCFTARTKKSAVRDVVRLLRNILRSGLHRWRYQASVLAIKGKLATDLRVMCGEITSSVVDSLRERLLDLEKQSRDQSVQLRSCSSHASEGLLTANRAYQHASNVEMRIIEANRSHHEELNEGVRNLGLEVQSILQNIEGIGQRLDQFEKNAAQSILQEAALEQTKDRLQHLFTDMVLLWNSVKQLEMSKMDQSAAKEILGHNAEYLKNEVANLLESRETAAKKAATEATNQMAMHHEPPVPDTLEHKGRPDVTRPRSAMTFATSVAVTSIDIGAPLLSELENSRDRKSSVSQGFKSSRSHPALIQPRSSKAILNSDINARGRRIPPAGGWGYNRSLLPK